MPVDHPLLRKLGVKENETLLLMDAPDEAGLLFGDAPRTIHIRGFEPEKHSEPLGVTTVLLFAVDRAHMEFAFHSVFRWMSARTALWTAWPKKASGVVTDLDFDSVQRMGLDHGLVDNKVCAIDNTWSGLRHVVRKEHREHWNPAHHM